MVGTATRTDSTAAISFLQNPQTSERNEYIVIETQYIKDVVRSKAVKLDHVRTYHQAADK